MALGDVVWFDQALVDSWKKIHDLSADDIRVALITAAVTPVKTAADPRWGGGGSTNYSSNQVTPGGNYASGGAAVASPSVVLSAGVAKFSGNNVSWAQSVSNPNNATWGIGYNNTDPGKRALFFVDLGGAFDMTSGPLSINWNAAGIAVADQTP